MLSDMFSDSDIRVRLVKPELEGTSFVGKKSNSSATFFFFFFFKPSSILTRLCHLMMYRVLNLIKAIIYTFCISVCSFCNSNVIVLVQL